MRSVRALQFASLAIPAALLAGCPPGNQETAGLELEVRNDSRFRVAVTLDVDGYTMTLAADAAKVSHDTLAVCPVRVVLREVRVSDDTGEVLNVIEQGQLNADTNYVCGDTVLIEISDAGARLSTVAASSE